MTTAIIVNVVLDIFVVTLLLSLLGRGIVMDKRATATQSGQARDAARRKTTQPARPQLGHAFDFSA
jgi:hypothetical protein